MGKVWCPDYVGLLCSDEVSSTDLYKAHHYFQKGGHSFKMPEKQQRDSLRRKRLEYIKISGQTSIAVRAPVCASCYVTR